MDRFVTGEMVAAYIAAVYSIPLDKVWIKQELYDGVRRGLAAALDESGLIAVLERISHSEKPEGSDMAELDTLRTLCETLEVQCKWRDKDTGYCDEGFTADIRASAAAILALLDENERLRVDRDMWKGRAETSVDIARALQGMEPKYGTIIDCDETAAALAHP